MVTTAKTIRVSDDDVTYYTLPGNSGEMTDDMGQIVDTIFGQTFESNQPGLVGWSINANALYKGFAGYVASLKKISGAPTSTTGEACSLLTGKRYQIDDASKQIWDRTGTIVVYDNAVDHTADVVLIDYLNGIVEFDSGYTVTGSVTVDVDYYTMATVAKGRSFTLTQQTAAIDDTDFETAQANSGHRTFEAAGLRTLALEIAGVYDATNTFRTELLTRGEFIIEIAPGGSTLTEAYARGFFKYTGRSQSGDVGALEEETINFNCSVPVDDLLETPFKWVFPGTATISPGLQKIMEAWQNQTNLYVRYLPDGAAGWEGQAVVSEASISGGLEVMNEFTVSLQGDGQASAYP